MAKGIFNVLFCKLIFKMWYIVNFRGVRYEGGWKFGLRHGYGVIAYKDGTIYKGTWQNGKKHGFGTMTYPSGN